MNDTETLFNEHIAFAKRLVYHCIKRYRMWENLDDVTQVGLIALYEAARSYEPQYGARFATYAGHRINGAIIDHLRASTIGSRRLGRFKRLCAAAQAEAEQAYGRAVTSAELADWLDMPHDSYNVYAARAHSSCLVDDAKIEHVKDDEPTPYDIAERDQIYGRLRDAVDRLPPRLRDVVRWYYWHGHTLKVIAKMLGITESRVSQLLIQAHELLGIDCVGNQPILREQAREHYAA